MINFDKEYVKSQISVEDIFSLLEEWDAEPELTPSGLRAKTICHQSPSETNNKKLYYYSENQMFYCYSNCGSFDIFDLAIKVADIQENKKFDLNDAVRALAYRFSIFDYVEEVDNKEELEDWKIFNRYDRIKEIKVKDYSVTLKEYDPIILSRFNYGVKIGPWLADGISQQALDKAQIGFFPGDDQITIPHYDINNRFVGLRGRALDQEEAQYFGKYKPIKINGELYSHPLGMNLYGLNWAKDNIRTMEKAVVFESEKAVLRYMTEFGCENSIAVACCGSSLSAYQAHMLMAVGAKEIIIAFDRDWVNPEDEVHKKQTENYYKLNDKYKTYVTMSFLYDKNKITELKSSPIDESKEKFLTLFKERVII